VTLLLLLGSGCRGEEILPNVVIPTRLTLPFRPALLCHPDTPYPVIPTAVEGSQPVGKRSFGFAQDDKLVGNPDTPYSAIPTCPTLSSRHALLCHSDTPYPVIPTAVEGSQPVGRRSFGFAQDDKLVGNPDTP